MSDFEKFKDSLLSLFGSMPPKDDKSQKDWEIIRKKARDEYLNRNLLSTYENRKADN